MVKMLSLQRLSLLSSRFAKNKLNFLESILRNCSTATARVELDNTVTATEFNYQNTDLQNITERSEYLLEQSVDFSVHGPSCITSNGVLDREYQEYSESVEQSRAPGSCMQENSNVENLQESSAALNCHSSVNLYGCMQTNVPEPYSTESIGYADYRNMPGGGGRILQKYVADNQNTTHPTRSFHWSTAVSGAAAPKIAYMQTPEGIQGDDCAQYKTWIENCRRFGLANCDQQLQEMKEGRKTLAQILEEQDELIRKVVESYGHKAQMRPSVAATKQIDINAPCPQGIQGDDCIRFKLWLENCHRFDLKECDEQFESVQSGRKTLKQVFEEQEKMIRSIVQQYQQKRKYSTSANQGNKQEVCTQSPPSSESTPPPISDSTTPEALPSENLTSANEPKLSQRERLKRAVKDYGATVIVFHVGISLMSLGGFYLAVSSGLDVVGMLAQAGIGQTFLESKLATGASTFVIAYAVHKVFAPVRIGITLTATPFIVRYLRKIGVLKVKVKSS